VGETLKGDLKAAPSERTDSRVPSRPATELETEPTDDLQALLARAALNASTYKEFASSPRTPKPLRAESVRGETFARRQEQPKDHARNAEGRALNPLLRTGAEGVPPRPVARRSESDGNLGRTPQTPRKPAPSGMQNRSHSAPAWSTLNRLLSRKTDGPERHFIQALAEKVGLPTLFLCSPSGGTGKTTILATLARCLSISGERVFVAENAAASLVPFYFGAQDLRDGALQSFTAAESDARVDVLGIPASILAAREIPLDQEQDDVISALHDAAGRSDRMLMDVSPFHTQEILNTESDSHVGLICLVPDLNCVIGVMRLEEALHARREDETGGLEPFYLLSKFDSSLALHRSIQSRLRDELGDRLVPLTIRRSDAIPEALADGKTVIDYCPDAGIAEDFMGLANWLLHEQPVRRMRGPE